MRALAAAALLAGVAGSALGFDLQGHRGARGLAPENSLPGFAIALGIGVHTLELDTRVTRDGVLVIHHDPGLNPATTRGADGKWLAAKGPLIRSLDAAALAAYDVGRLNPETRYARTFAAQKPVDGTRIPKLVELFSLVRQSGNTTVRFDIETKSSPLAPDESPAPEPYAKLLVDLLRTEGMAARASIQSFDWRTLQAVQKLAPGLPTVYLSAQRSWLDNIGADSASGSPWVAGFQHAVHGSVPRMVKAAGGTIWAPYHGDLDAAKLAEAHALGLKVIPWTVNETGRIRDMLALGVDGIISDRPDLVREEMSARGMPLPAPTPVQ